MTNAPASWDPAEYKDVETQNYIARTRAEHPDDPKALARALRGVSKVARDHARTPVQWDGSAHAGFTKSAQGPWMKVNDNYKEVNAAAQSGREDSTLEFWRRVIGMRKERLGLFVHERFELFEPEGEKTVVFGKEDAKTGERVLVVLNFSGEKQAWNVPEGGRLGRCLVGNVAEPERGAEKVLLPWEGRMYEAATAEGVNGVNGVDGVHEINGVNEVNGVNGHA